MKTTNITGIATNASGSAVAAMETAIRPILTAYDNITFVERYTVASGRYRDIYAIDEIENLYFTLENESTTNGYITVRVFLKDNVYTNTYIETYTVNCVTDIVVDYFAFNNFLYTFSKNNKLYALMLAPKNALAPAFVAFESGYIYIKETACKDDIAGSKQSLNRYIPNVTYAEAEKALFSKQIITTSNNSSSTPFQSISNVIFKILNQQFNTMNFSLIDIDGVKYRQVYQYYLFIENGDEE